MQFWRVVATTAVLVLASASAARAETFYASPNGDDDEDTAVCTDTARCSFRVARLKANATPDLDTVNLVSGVYVAVGDQTFTQPVAIEGVRGNPPELRVSTVSLLAPGSSAHDLRVRGATDGVVLTAVGSELTRLDVSNGQSPNTRTVCQLDGAGSQMTDSACWANPSFGAPNAIALDEAAPGAGTFTLRGVTAQSPGAALIIYGGAAAVSSSILEGRVDVFGGTVSADHSATSLPGPGNIVVAQGSLFPNLLLNGVHPAAGSPTIDAGVSASPYDLDGKPRSLGSAPDMGAYEWVPTAPAVITGEVTAVTATGAVVPGSVDPRGAATSFSVQYGTSSYTSSLAAGSAGSATLPVGISATLTGLSPATTYHYRVVASNSEGTTAGEDRTFTTAALPAATPTPTPKPKVTVTLASNKKCLRSRSTSLRVKIAKGGTITAVEVYVNSKRVKRVTKAADIKKAIKVSKLPKGRYTLEVRVKTKDGRTVKSSRKYRTCSSSR